MLFHASLPKRQLVRWPVMHFCVPTFLCDHGAVDSNLGGDILLIVLIDVVSDTIHTRLHMLSLQEESVSLYVQLDVIVRSCSLLFLLIILCGYTDAGLVPTQRLLHTCFSILCILEIICVPAVYHHVA